MGLRNSSFVRFPIGDRGGTFLLSLLGDKRYQYEKDSQGRYRSLKNGHGKADLSGKLTDDIKSSETK